MNAPLFLRLLGSSRQSVNRGFDVLFSVDDGVVAGGGGKMKSIIIFMSSNRPSSHDIRKIVAHPLTLELVDGATRSPVGVRPCHAPPTPKTPHAQHKVPGILVNNHA